MRISRCLLTVTLALMLVAGIVTAQEDSSASAGMPQMGPPPEMKEIAWMVGSWDFKGEMQMHPGADWTPMEATAVFSYVCDGAAMQMTYESEFMGMAFHGLNLTTYNSNSEQWQDVWTDNMSGRFIMYSGTVTDGKRVVSGSYEHMGQPMQSRATSFNMTETSWDWTMEDSMDGETWTVSMKGTYTKQ